MSFFVHRRGSFPSRVMSSLDTLARSRKDSTPFEVKIRGGDLAVRSGWGIWVRRQNRMLVLAVLVLWS